MRQYSNLSNEQIAKTFGRTLQKIRLEKGLTQHDLEDNSGISLRMISDMERGIRQPSLTTLFKISKGLGIKINELISQLLKELS